jgi:hypothetical protein
MPKKISRPLLNYVVAMAMLVVSLFVITALLKAYNLSMPVRVALALVPPTIWVFCLTFLLRLIRGLDEMIQRIHLEALAIAFTGVAVAILTCEYLRKAGLISHLLPDHVLIIMMTFLLIGYLIAWRRYK